MGPDMAARIGAHFTVCHAIPEGDDWRARVESLEAAGPLRVRICGVRHWGSPADGIYLEVDDVDGTVRDARRRLAVEESAGVVYAPHVTLTHPRTTSADIAAAA